MALQAYLAWNCLDKTLYWHERYRLLVQRGIFNGGLISPIPGSLQINVGDDLFAAVSFGGMVVRDDDGATTTLNVSSDPISTTVLWVVCYVRYVNLSSPIMSYMVLTDAQYSAHVEQDYLIVLGRLNIPPAAIDVQPADIDYTVKDVVDPINRSAFRGTVATSASLPTGTPTINRDGDFFLVQDTGSFYRWDGSAWSLVSGGNNEGNGIFQMAEMEKARTIEKSGVITDVYANPNEPSTGDNWVGRVPVEEDPTTANVFSVRNITALVNGHFLHIPYTTITLTGPPPGSTRWDAVWLEVWREEVDSGKNTWLAYVISHELSHHWFVRFIILLIVIN